MLDTTQHNTYSCSVRIKWIDCAKLFAILLVILGHTKLKINSLASFIYMFHMPLFFFLSGAVQKTRTVKEELKHSAKSLLLPLVFGYFISYFFAKMPLVCAWALHGNKEELEGFFHQTLKVIAGLFLGLDSPYTQARWDVLWFLEALFFSRLIFCLVSSIHDAIIQAIIHIQASIQGKKNRQEMISKKLICVLFVILQVATCLLCISTGLAMKKFNIPSPHNIDKSLQSYFCFALGNICFPFINDIFCFIDEIFCCKKNNRGLSFFLVFMQLIFCIALFFVSFEIAKVNGFGSVVFAFYGKNAFIFFLNLFLVIFTCIILSHIITLPNFLLFFAQNTLGVLMFHDCFSLPVLYFIFEHAIQGFNHNFISFFQAIVLSFLALLLCALPIYIAKRFFPFVIGKTKTNYPTH